ncbi:MAG: class II aldolase/adducin family protein [Spirulina sp. SIO3F2]|nr:class II aldolase/adducin family protein [Spirulina sp. SIO3F2]
MLQPNLPKPASYDRIKDERLHRQQCLAAGLRLFAYYGFDEGVAGHITARDPELTDHFWVNPFGMYFGHIRVSDLLLVNHQGEVVQGDRPVNAAAFAIHSQIHQARPDIVAAAHSHSIYGKAWATQGRLLEPLTQDACSFYQDHVVFEDYTGVVLDPSEGWRIAQTLGNCKAAILCNHGLLTVGQTVEAAVWWFIAMERACQVQLLAEAAGNPMQIAPEVAQLTQSQIGTPYMGWFSFQSEYERIVSLQPDLLN